MAITHLRCNNCIISVHVDGKAMPFYLRADGTPFVEGIPGTSYEVRVWANSLYGRIEVVFSVDGMNTLQKETADWKENRGMILSFGQTWKNKGWRLDDDTVAEFIFADPEASVAAAAGVPKNVGVIGLAIFEEYRRPAAPIFRGGGKYFKSFGSGGMHTNSTGGIRGQSLGGDAERGVEISARGGRMESMDLERSVSFNAADVGTGAGETKADSIGHTTFTRASQAPSEIIQIQYRTRATLEKMGLFVSEPQAFPVGKHDTGYRNLLKK